VSKIEGLDRLMKLHRLGRGSKRRIMHGTTMMDIAIGILGLGKGYIG